MIANDAESQPSHLQIVIQFLYHRCTERNEVYTILWCIIIWYPQTANFQFGKCYQTICTRMGKCCNKNQLIQNGLMMLYSVKVNVAQMVVVFFNTSPFQYILNHGIDLTKLSVCLFWGRYSVSTLSSTPFSIYVSLLSLVQRFE